MIRHEPPPSEAIGTPVGSPDTRGWTTDEILAWVRTGAFPKIKPQTIPRQLRIAVWKRDDGICGICHEPADPLDWTCDHILPHSVGGPTVVDNLRVTHPRCNRGRPHPHKMTLEELGEATDEWTANEVASDGPTFQEFREAHRDTPAVTNGEWTCGCPLCTQWRERVEERVRTP